MRHRKKKVTLDRKTEARGMLLRNLAASVLIYEKVNTTEAKAKAVRSRVEKMITLAKKGDLASLRRLIAYLPQKTAVTKAVEVLKGRYEKRVGGYTRIVKIGARQGDGAKVVMLELV
jgi:large subunit ribosomal protein L17